MRRNLIIKQIISFILSMILILTIIPNISVKADSRDYLFKLAETARSYTESGVSINNVHVHMETYGKTESNFQYYFDNHIYKDENYVIDKKDDKYFDINTYGDIAQFNFDRSTTKYIEIIDNSTKDVIYSKHYTLVDKQMFENLNIDVDYGKNKTKSYTVKLETVVNYRAPKTSTVIKVPTIWTFTLNMAKSVGRLYIRQMDLEGDSTEDVKDVELQEKYYLHSMALSKGLQDTKYSFIVLGDCPISKVELDGKEIKDKDISINTYPDSMVINEKKDYYKEDYADSYYHNLYRIIIKDTNAYTHHTLTVTDINNTSKTIEFDGGNRKRRSLNITSNFESSSNLSDGWRYEKGHADSIKQLYQDIYDANINNSTYLPIVYGDYIDTYGYITSLYDPVYGVNFDSIDMNKYLNYTAKNKYVFYGWYDKSDIEFKNKLDTPIPPISDPDELLTDKDTNLVARYVTLDEYEKLKTEEEKANHTHTWVETKVEPTCEQDGYILKTCKCGESTKEILKALGHDYTDIKVEPTCTKDGYTLKKCKTCGAEKDKVIIKAGHNYVESKVVAPTCTEKGYTEYKCSRCNNVKKDNFVNAKGHTFVTLKNKDSIKEYCKVCGFIKSYTITPVKFTLNNVTNIKKKVNKNKVTLSWNKVNNAQGYIIYRIDNNKRVKLKTTKNTNVTFNQTENINKKYSIRAYVKNGNTYIYSPKYSSVTVKTSIIKPNRINTVIVKKVKNTTYKVIWNKEKYATSYQVQYSTRKDFKNVKTIKVSNRYNFKTLPKLSHKKTYYIRVRAVRTIKNSSNTSTWSSIKKIIVK